MSANKPKTERISVWTVCITLSLGDVLGIRRVRATCCSHVLVSLVCGMIVCGHCPVYLCVACVCRQLVVVSHRHL